MAPNSATPRQGPRSSPWPSRRRNAETGNWENGETTYLNASAFGPTAEHVAESLATGDRVVVTGRLVERSFTATQGQRAGQEIRRHESVIDELGVSLRYATARPVKARRNGELHVVEDDENARAIRHSGFACDRGAGSAPHRTGTLADWHSPRSGLPRRT